MPTISLTDFMDFVSKAGTSKMTKVKQIKNRDEYQPAFDFWKALREGIQDFHRLNKGRTYLDQILESLTDQKKRNIYPDLIKQYKSFLGRKKIEWFQPPYKECIISDLNIHLNPEIGLAINGEPTVIKLYFKAESLSKQKADIVTVLMTKYLDEPPVEGQKYCVLDVPQKKLFTGDRNMDLIPLLEGEAASFVKIWNGV